MSRQQLSANNSSDRTPLPRQNKNEIPNIVSPNLSQQPHNLEQETAPF